MYIKLNYIFWYDHSNFAHWSPKTMLWAQIAKEFFKVMKDNPIFSFPAPVSNEHAFLASLVKKCLCFKKFHVDSQNSDQEKL